MREFIGKKSGVHAFEYTWKDVVLYALSVGAQRDELSFIYEDAPEGFQVIPSFCVIPPRKALDSVVASLGLDPVRRLHGEQRILLHHEIPPDGRLNSVAEISNIYDKGKAALIIVRTETTSETGELLFENDSVIFYRGGGGFGGDPGPKTEPVLPPEGRAPDFQVIYPIPNNQAALYRLNIDGGDPMHIDPLSAEEAGFRETFLQGLCTFGFATRAVVHAVCDGDGTRLKEFKTRFSNVVFPGETLITEGWEDTAGLYILQVRTKRAVVMNHAYAVIDEHERI